MEPMTQGRLPMTIPGGRKPRPEESRRPARRRYAYGAEVERRARAKLAAMGFTPTRAAGSRGPADLVGIGPTGETIALQVKAGHDRPGPAERTRILADLRAAYPSETTRVELWFWSADEKQWHRFREESTDGR